MDTKIPRTSIAVKKWMSFIAVIWVQAISGTNFDFSVYSSTLKTVMNINQIQLNNLAVASDLGKLMGWVSGLVCMVLPTWAVLGIAVSLGAVGYGVQWLIVHEIINPLPYWLVYILCMMAGNSICWLNTVCFRAVITSFPTKRGIASGLNTSYVGLTAVIYTNLANLIDRGNPSFYLILNCVVPAIVSVIAAFFLNDPLPDTSTEDEGDMKNMYFITFTAIVTAVYSIAFEFLPQGKRLNDGIYTGVLALLLLIPLYVPLKGIVGLKRLKRNASSRVTNLDLISSLEMGMATHHLPPAQYTDQESKEPSMLRHQNSKDSYNDLIGADNRTVNGVEKPNEHEIIQLEHIDQQSIGSQRLDGTVLSDNVEVGARLQKSVPALGEEHEIIQLLRSVDFWLYYFVYFCGGTVGLVYINNLGQIVQSLGYSKTSVLVSLASSLGFLGRIASGLPDYFQCLKQGLPRPAWIGIWMAAMVVAFFMLAFVDQSAGVLYTSTAILGTSVGAITTIAVPISSELFGIQRFGVNHNVLITNIAFGSLLFGNMAGLVYVDHSSPAPETNSTTANTVNGIEERHLCMGRDCYAKTFILWGCICSLGLVLCVILSLRTRQLYKSLHTNPPSSTQPLH